MIGCCSYMDVNWQSRNCMVGWFIGDESARGHGYGTDTIFTLLRVCFEELGMHRVSLHVMGHNEGAIRLYDRIGFVREGVFRDQIFAKGRFWDQYEYAMLEDEWKKTGRDYFDD